MPSPSHVSNIFSVPLEYTSKKSILRKKYSRCIWTPCLHSRSYAYRSFCDLPFILARFGWNLNLLDRFSQNVRISNFMNTRLEGPSYYIRTDMTKLKGISRNFANASKNHSQFKEIKLFFLICCIDFRDIPVTNGNRGCILRDKKFGNSGQFYSCWDWEERQNLKQGSMGSNPQPPAHEEVVKAIVQSYSLNNITMVHGHIDTRSIQFWR